MKMALNKIWLLILTSLILVGCLVFYIYADSKRFWKVIDPLDPRFQVEKFCFNDYGSNEELAEMLKVLVPVGTPFEQAHNILSGPEGKGGRDISNRKHIITDAITLKKVDVEGVRAKAERTFFYGHGGCKRLMNSVWAGWKVFVFYDQHAQVMQIIVLNEPLYDEGKL